jgi:cell division protein FtsI/penicillin-binding protein 2
MNPRYTLILFALLTPLLLISALRSDEIVGDEEASCEVGRAAPSKAPEKHAASPRKPLAPPFALDLKKAEPRDGEYRVPAGDGRFAVLTLDARLQALTERYFMRYKVPAGAAVVMRPDTGRILALVHHRLLTDFARRELVAFDTLPPAASLFKIVTAAALIEKTPVTPKTVTCFVGGSQRLDESHLEDVSPEEARREEGKCMSLTNALGRSINPIFAKLFDRHLDNDTLLDYAGKFGFNRELPFDVAADIAPSTVTMPGDRLERARAAAGFWSSHISPLHAAMIAQSLALGGTMMRPFLVDRIEDADESVLYRGAPARVGQVIAKETVAHLLKGLRRTTDKGSSHLAFFDELDKPVLGDIAVAGKTGTLFHRDPFRAYTWFIAIAPADKPEVVVAALAVNKPHWRVKGPDVAAYVLKKYFDSKKRRHHPITSFD